VTLSEYEKKDLLTNEDALSVIRESQIDEIMSFIEKGPDHAVWRLLSGIWIAKEKFLKSEVLRAIMGGLFGSCCDIRWATGTSALRLAKAAGLQKEVQKGVLDQWINLKGPETGTFLAGFQGFEGFEDWGPTLTMLFELNADTEIRVRMIRMVSNVRMKSSSKTVREMLLQMLKQMPDSPSNYARPDQFLLIRNLKSVHLNSLPNR
jgi:hypothetical protein